MRVRINPEVKNKPLKAFQYVLQWIIMPFTAGYLASTGMNWVLAGFLGIGTSFLIIVIFAFIAGIRVFFQILNEPVDPL